MPDSSCLAMPHNLYHAGFYSDGSSWRQELWMWWGVSWRGVFRASVGDLKWQKWVIMLGCWWDWSFGVYCILRKQGHSKPAYRCGLPAVLAAIQNVPWQCCYYGHCCNYRGLFNDTWYISLELQEAHESSGRHFILCFPNREGQMYWLKTAKRQAWQFTSVVLALGWGRRAMSSRPDWFT